MKKKLFVLKLDLYFWILLSQKFPKTKKNHFFYFVMVFHLLSKGQEWQILKAWKISSLYWRSSTHPKPIGMLLQVGIFVNRWCDYSNEGECGPILYGSVMFYSLNDFSYLGLIKTQLGGSLGSPPLATYSFFFPHLFKKFQFSKVVYMFTKN
jgi:hypothetical protein